MPYDNNNGPRYNSNSRNNNRYNSPPNGQRQGGGRRNGDSQTDGLILYNEKAGKFLKTRFWNRCLGLEIGTYPPNAQLNFDMIRNAQVFGHVFSFATLFELHDMCEEVMQQLKDTGHFDSIATEAGQKKDIVVEISNGSNIGVAPGIYLVIYKGVDTGKRTNMLDMFPFGSTKVMKNYDHNTGSSKEEIRPNGDFKKFMMILKESAKAFTMAQAHAVQDSQKYEKLTTFAALSALTAQLGIDISKSVEQTRTSGQSSYNRGGQQQGGGWNGRQNSGSNPQNFRRSSPSGQWNGQYRQQTNPQQAPSGSSVEYQPQAPGMMNALMNDEPVDINLDAATLQNVSLSDFK